MKTNFKVYIHTCPNNKVYIGITCKKPEYRWSNGNGYKYNLHFWRAIQKYGWDNIKHEILFDGLNEDEAKNKEKELILKYKSNNGKYGYNLTEGGDGTCGYKHTEEAKEKSRQSHLGKIPWNKGKQMSEEYKEKCRQRSKGNKNMLGKKRSEESKRKQGESRKGKKRSEEFKEKCRQSHLGKKRSEESKRKQGESRKGKKRSEESKRKQSESMKGENHPMYGKHQSEEWRKNMSESLKGRKYYNNGEICIRAYECPEGFTPGMLKKQ